MSLEPGKISVAVFTKELFDLLEETFENVQGAYLDKGDSLFETLEGITADEASIPVGSRCASIAAHIEHVIFYLEVLEKHIQGPPPGRQDWGEIWARVGGVTESEWGDLKTRLRTKYVHITSFLHNIEEWDREEVIGGAMSIVVHTAYHLGEVRQACCTVKAG